MEQLKIRAYQSTDEEAVLELISLNIPRWFAPAEREALVQYLAEEREDYFVLDADAKVVGSGGINYLPATQRARISWDILHPAYQGRGLGSRLLQYRLGLLRDNPAVRAVIVRTSQLVYPYYENHGFRVTKVIADYWAPGFDLYEMEQTL